VKEILTESTLINSVELHCLLHHGIQPLYGDILMEISRVV